MAAVKRRDRPGRVADTPDVVELSARGAGWVAARNDAIGSMADLFARLDADLPERFTTRDVVAAMRSSRRLGQLAAFCFPGGRGQRGLR